MKWSPIRDKLISNLVVGLLKFLANSVLNILDHKDVENVQTKLKTKPKDANNG